MPPEAPTTRQIRPAPHHAACDCELRFTTGGDAEWFAQSAEYYVACPEPAEWDNDAAQSGTIGSGQETWMQTTVVGPGRIQFRFKMSWVSGDGLAFCVDEGVVASWGQSDTWDPTGWFDIPSGTHTLKWKYVKYSGSTAGSAWIDAIQWTGGVPASGGGADWQQITYTYDPSGRRIAKLVSPPGGGDVDGTVTRYVYDGDQCIAEYDGSDNLLRKYIHGPCIDEPRSTSLRAGSFCMLESPPSGGIEAAGSYAGTYYYHFDALGSVVALSDADGETVQVYEYDVYGQPAASDPNHPNRFMFTGREFDKETGLYYYRARYYNPTVGRFLQTDPIGYADGLNMYCYCHNNSILLGDPFGCEGSAGDPGIISLCAITEGTFYNSWGMRITPDSSYRWQTGMNFLDALISATTTYGEIATLNIFSHGWIWNSEQGYRHRGGVWGQGYEGYEDSGFYGQSRSYDHPESRDLDDLQELIDQGKIKFAEGGTIFMNACHAANTGYFARELAIMTGCTVYAATGKVAEYRLGDDWVQWRTFAEGGETEPITWKKFLPDGTEVDLGVTVLQISEGDTSPTVPVQRRVATN